MRPYILSECTWADLQTRRFDVAVLPWGATEAHNFHLPYATDVIEADALAAEAARKAWDAGAKVVVLPTVPFGVNTGQADIYLDLNLNPSTQLAILRDLVTVMNRQGIRKLLILNSHGGNDFRAMLRELGLAFPQMFLSTCNWFQLPGKAAFFDTPGDHADEMETSLLLHLRPDLVLPRNTWGDGTEKKHRIAAFGQGWAWAERRWSQISADTGVGAPHAATAERGKAFFDWATDHLAKLMRDLAALDVDNMYV